MKNLAISVVAMSGADMSCSAPCEDVWCKCAECKYMYGAIETMVAVLVLIQWMIVILKVKIKPVPYGGRFSVNIFENGKGKHQKCCPLQSLLAEEQFYFSFLLFSSTRRHKINLCRLKKSDINTAR